MESGNLGDIYPKMLDSANTNDLLQDTSIFHDLNRNGFNSLKEGTMSKQDNFVL